MNNFVHRTLCRNYEQSAKAFIHEWRKHKQHVDLVDEQIVNDYHEHLAMLRLFLDNEVGAMPRPKWFYDDKDESTWLFTYRKGINKTFILLQDRRR